ncbi:hypothetical protein AVEN_167926-1 [Araneus ventricosus]|uniref:Uncharacterized protein n=1 Tax=Araneus ventricosus TaxID=182803 RepID=A0A4Y2FVC1_ARAVE|nr:hypothetical protein AVEN_167926-1 [Araneus ventricosus]
MKSQSSILFCIRCLVRSVAIFEGTSVTCLLKALRIYRVSTKVMTAGIVIKVVSKYRNVALMRYAMRPPKAAPGGKLRNSRMKSAYF